MTVRRTTPLRVGVVIPAGGTGARLGAALPKQFLPLGGTPILVRTLLAFDRHPGVDEIVIAAPREHLDRVIRLVGHCRARKVRAVVQGGTDRQGSVGNGLAALSDGVTVVLVHDAVRPFVDRALITSVIREAERHGAAIAAIPASDTILREGKRGFLTEALDRSTLWTVQTPQGFRLPDLLAAHRAATRAGYRGTDEGSLLLRLGKQVKIVEASDQNIKITTRGDLKRGELLLKGRKQGK